VCGRFTLTVEGQQLLELFGLTHLIAHEPRFNIAPTSAVPIVRAYPTGERDLTPMRWGLIPSWAKDKKIGNRMINARSETLAEKPSFRRAYARRRCLVPADGWFEWTPPPAGAPKGRPKQPWHIRRPDRAPFAFAGLWEQWSGPGAGRQGDGVVESIESFTIITTAANRSLAHLHHRMPVVLPEESWQPWLDPGLHETASLQELLAPSPEGLFEAVPVSHRVNSVRNDEPSVLEAVDPGL
jgi:putative SOS response-associated peptidase YedK